MVKGILAFVAIALATPVAAQTQISTYRLDRIYDVAMKACPVALANANAYKTNSGDYVVDYAKRMGFSDIEIALLLSFCRIYVEGRSDELDIQLIQATK